MEEYNDKKERAGDARRLGGSVDKNPAGHGAQIATSDSEGADGTVIGSAGCNISRMQIGQDKHTATALGILNLDGEVDDSLLDAVRAIAAVENARLVR